MDIKIHAVSTAKTPQAAAQSTFPPVWVGDELLSDAEIAQELQYHPAEQLAEAWQAAATSLVIKTLLAQRAAELGITAETEEERTALLLERELQVPAPDAAQCLHYFESNRARFYTPVLLAVSHILLPAAPDDMAQRDEQRLLANELLAQMRAAPDGFTEAALRYSACSSAAQGGSLGQLSKGQTVEEFERQVWLLPVGLCPQPVESRFGFHLVRVDQRVEGEPLPYAQVETRIRQYLNEQVTRRALSQYLQVLGAEIGVSGVEFAN